MLHVHGERHYGDNDVTQVIEKTLFSDGEQYDVCCSLEGIRIVHKVKWMYGESRISIAGYDDHLETLYYLYH